MTSYPNGGTMHRIHQLAGAVAIWGALSWPGCGGSDKVTAPPTTAATAPAPVRSLVTKGVATMQGPDGEFTYFLAIPFTTVIPGTVDVVVDWTYPENTIWLFVSSNVCTAQQFQKCPGAACECGFLVSSQATSPKPRSLNIPSTPAGARSLFIWNLGPREESVDYQVHITN
jgi:hypothetical protein